MSAPTRERTPEAASDSTLVSTELSGGRFGVVARMLSDAPLVTSVFLMVLLATTVLASGPLYSAAVVGAGFEKSLATAPVTESGIEVTVRAETSSLPQLADVGDRIAAITAPFSPAATVIAESETYTFADEIGPIAGLPAITAVATMPALPSSAELNAGRWPEPDGSRFEAVLHHEAAEAIDVAVGDTVLLESRGGDPVEVVIVGTFSPLDRAGREWWDSATIRDGVAVGELFTSVGPFVLTATDFSATGGRSTHRWRVFPDPSAVAVDSIGELAAVPERIRREVTPMIPDASVLVESGLPHLASQSLAALPPTRAAVLVITLLLAALALYGLVLAATLLTEARSVETSLIRSRGASVTQLGMSAALEGLIVVVTAVLLAPFLAFLAVEAMSGSSLALGLDLAPRLTSAVFLAAAVAGVLSLVVLSAPAFAAGRTLAGARGARSRREGPPAFQRLGLDVVLVVFALLGLWQLRRSGTAVAEDLEGRLGVDPVLVLAPALALFAGALVMMRLVPVIGAIGERLTSSTKSLVPGLSAQELSRRPQRVARPALLVVMAVAIAVFAATFSLTWRTSQTEQADAIVGADVGVEPNLRPSASIPDGFLSNSYRNAGATAVSPVARLAAGLTSETTAAPIVAVDGSAAPTVLRLADGSLPGPEDGSVTFFPEATITLDGVALPEAAALLVDIDARHVAGTAVAGDVQTAIVVVDGHGLLHRISGTSIPIDSPGTASFPLQHTVGETVLSRPGPLQLVEIELRVPTVPSPLDAFEDPAEVSIDLSGFRTSAGPLMIGSHPWNQAYATTQNVVVVPDAAASRSGEAIAVVVHPGATNPSGGRAVVHVPAAVAAPPDGGAVGIVVTPGFLDATGLQVGDTATVVVGLPVPIVIVGSIAFVPTEPDAEVAALMDLGAYSAYRYLALGGTLRPDAWLLSADESEVARLVDTLDNAPFQSESAVDRHALAEELANDPVAVGILGSLTIGVLVAAVIALVGFTVSAAASARQRTTEFAVLRALGMRAAGTRRLVLAGSVWLVVPSLLLGMGLGLAMAYLVMPALAIGVDGAPAVPEPMVRVPWPAISAFLVLAMAIFLVVPIVVDRVVAAPRTSAALRIGEDR